MEGEGHTRQAAGIHWQQPDKQACTVFISHAGEIKWIASTLHTLLTQAAGLSAFLDEKDLVPGTSNAAAMEFELRNAPVVVLLLTRDYVCKKWPMWELEIALTRSNKPTKVLPVLVDITVEELGDLSGKIYCNEGWSGRRKPADEDLERWAALGNKVTSLVCIRKDQVLPTCWAGDLAQLVIDRCIAALKEMKLLPTDYTLRDPRRLPMFISRPDSTIIARDSTLKAIQRDMMERRRLLITGGPGEGKTVLARRAAADLFNDGCFPGGAFEADMTAVDSNACEAVAALLVPYLKQVLGNAITQDATPSWKTLELWLQVNDKPWVLLLDNTEDLIRQYKSPNVAQTVLDNLVAKLTGASRGALHIVIVSRTSALRLPQAAVCQLKQLQEVDAAAVLRSYCPNILLSGEQVVDIAQVCGCNPLELKLVGGLLNSECITIEDVVTAGRAARVMAGRVDGDPFIQPITMLVQWWKRLLRPILKEKLMAVAALSTFAGSFSARSAVEVAGAVCASAIDSTDLQGLGVLQGASNVSGLDDRFQMHHLHREAAEKLLTQQFLCSFLVKCLPHRVALDKQQVAQHAFIRVTWQVAQQMKRLREELANPVAETPTSLTTKQLDMLLELPVTETPNINHMLGLLQECGTLSMLGHKLVALQLGILGREMHEVGQYHLAEPLYRRDLGIREEVLGPKHPDTATSLDNLALLLRAQGKLAEAEPLHKRALAISEEILGPKHPDTATSLSNLAGLKGVRTPFATCPTPQGQACS